MSNSRDINPIKLDANTPLNPSLSVAKLDANTPLDPSLSAANPSTFHVLIRDRPIDPILIHNLKLKKICL